MFFMPTARTTFWPAAPAMTAYYVSTSATQVIESSGQGWDVISSSVNYTLPANVEELVLTGNGLTGTGNSDDNVLYANGSNDILAGGAGNDSLLRLE